MLLLLFCLKCQTEVLSLYYCLPADGHHTTRDQFTTFCAKVLHAEIEAIKLKSCPTARSFESRHSPAAGDDGIEFWRQRLSNVTSRYEKVIMLGDSMGATGALLFSDLATLVQAFTPQVGREASLTA